MAPHGLLMRLCARPIPIFCRVLTPSMRNFHISIPVIANNTGADVYFRELATGLERHNHRVTLSFYSRKFELSSRWLGWAFRCPEDADLVHSKAEHALALDVGHRPLVITLAHSVFDPVLVRNKSVGSSVYHRLIVRDRILESFSRAKAVVTLSDYSRHRLAEDFGFPSALRIYSGVDEKRFRPLDASARTFRDKWDRKRFKLLYVGNWMKRKGADLLEPILRELGPDYVLYYTSGFRKNSAPPPAPNMVPLGRLTDDELVAAYNECDALLFPSRMEGFGYPIAEAMACAKPVIATNASSMPELLEDGAGGRLCPLDDVDAFVSAVRALAAQSVAEREAIGAHNRQRVLNHFTRERSIREYDALYGRLLQ